MTTLLAEHLRRAAHDRHRCQLCGTNIGRGETYLDQRCADGGIVWTFRCHTSCNARYWKAHRGMELFYDETVEWAEVLQFEQSLEATT